MAVNSIQLGQVWRSDADGQDYLVTKVYNEVFSQFAILRPAGITAPDAPTVRVKVSKSPEGASLPGYAFTQEGSDRLNFEFLVPGSRFSVKPRGYSENLEPRTKN
jgi:hypothetical protein